MPPTLQTTARSLATGVDEELLDNVGVVPVDASPNDLMQAGYSVTIFEKFAKPGGLMRTNIPAFRLPASVLDFEIGTILDMGVDIRYSSPVESMKSLQELADYLGLAKSTMHHHLTILRSAGLVRVRMKGNGDMHYSLRRDLIPDTAALLQGYLGAVGGGQ